MKFFALILGFFAATNVFAETIRLGELTGSAEHSLRASTGGRQDTDTKGRCRLAVNLDRSGDVLSFDYSYFECGGEVWNDAPFTVQVKGRELFLVTSSGSDRKVGTVSDDGAYEIRFSSSVRRVVREWESGPDCRRADLRQVERRFDLTRHLSYRFKPATGGAWELSRVERADELTQTTHGHCLDWRTVLRTTNREIRGSVAPQ